MAFKENLKSELAYQDMLVKELAEKTGISRHTLDNYLNVREHMPTADVAVKIARTLGVTVEYREHMPTADVAVKIARTLGVTVEYLVTGEEARTEKPSLVPETRALIQNFKLLCDDDRKKVLAIVQVFKNHGVARAGKGNP